MAERTKGETKRTGAGSARPAGPSASGGGGGWESPFSGASFGGADNGGPVGLLERPFFGKILLRGLATDAAFLRATESALGTALPLEPNTTAALGGPFGVGKGKEKGGGGGDESGGSGGSGGLDGSDGSDGSDGVGIILWLGPSEWLIWTTAREDVLSALDGGLAGIHSAVADVSDYYAILRLSGDLAREVLAHGCPLDLDASVFGSGSCAQSRFRAAAILLHCADDAPTYDVQVRWSYAEYLRRYLSEVASLCASARA